MKRSEKESFVEDFRDRLEGAPVIYLTDFTGLDVKSMTALRQGLKASGAEYIVVKNRLARLALRELELPDLTEVLTGPTGFILGRDDAVEPAKVVTDFAKDHHDRPVFKLGVLDRRIVDPGQIVRLASLPSRDQLLAGLAAALEGPLGSLATVLEAKLQEMAGLLDALGAKRERDS